MNKQQTEATKKKLKKEYQELPYTTNKLEWCNRKARELEMSYGKFCDWLGIK